MQNRFKSTQRVGRLSREQKKFLMKLAFIAENGHRIGQKHLGKVARILLVYLPRSPVLAVILAYLLEIEEEIINKIRELFQFQMEI